MKLVHVDTVKGRLNGLMFQLYSYNKKTKYNIGQAK